MVVLAKVVGADVLEVDADVVEGVPLALIELEEEEEEVLPMLFRAAFEDFLSINRKGNKILEAMTNFL